MLIGSFFFFVVGSKLSKETLNSSSLEEEF